MNPYYELANGIVSKAVEDYRCALKGQRIDKHTSVEKTIKECENFFRSEWFMVLTKVDGEMIIDKVKGEVYGSKTCTANS